MEQELTKERFTQIMHEEGIDNQKVIDSIWAIPDASQNPKGMAEDQIRRNAKAVAASPMYQLATLLMGMKKANDNKT